jgi:hypothetical protein
MIKEGAGAALLIPHFGLLYSFLELIENCQCFLHR